MNLFKRIIFKISYTDKNPVFRFFTRKKPVSRVFGHAYAISLRDKNFNVQYEQGKGGIIFDIHGGGYLFGNHMDENHFCHFLHEKTGMTTVSCYYDLADESKFPTQIEQIYQTVKTMCTDENIETDRVFIMGHSAGGNAAAAVTLMSLDRGDFHVDGNLLVYPVTDLSRDPKRRPRVKGNLITPSMMEVFNYMYFENEEDARLPYASPILASDELMSGMPPTYIMTCSQDALRIDGIRYGRKLKKHGVRVKLVEVNEKHGFLENGMYNFYGKPKEKSKRAARAAKMLAEWIVEEAGL